MATPTALDGFDVIVRPATFADAGPMATLAARAYFGTPVTRFLSPRHEIYFDDYRRSFQDRVMLRMFDPRNHSVVAVLASRPSTPIAYAIFCRCGSDVYTQAQIASRASIFLRVHSVVYTVYMRVREWLWPDRAADPENHKFFDTIAEIDGKRVWGNERYLERWHARSVVVGPDWQGRGIGKRLMKVVIDKAAAEHVCIGLEASHKGYWLYKSLGFRLLEKFSYPMPSVDDGRKAEGGGFMVWEPEDERPEEVAIE